MPIVFPTIKLFAAVFMIYKVLFVGINFIDVITGIQAHSKFELPDTKNPDSVLFLIYNFSSYGCHTASKPCACSNCVG